MQYVSMQEKPRAKANIAMLIQAKGSPGTTCGGRAEPSRRRERSTTCPWTGCIDLGDSKLSVGSSKLFIEDSYVELPMDSSRLGITKFQIGDHVRDLTSPKVGSRGAANPVPESGKEILPYSPKYGFIVPLDAVTLKLA
ncbi:hypothetical protein EVAR_78865_1 [Eumeta japonica]|uniref:Uncharacterized protein n=1 Tax=Eumeta variegata TaxID=151549 RepID=A0A4C1U2L0_EUMVA|nr:hypothetical protein EVAR_78865_1 [Eumeta japonica]